MKDSIREELHPKILTFVDAPASWNSSSAALAQCEWTEIEPVFSGLRPEKLNLGEATLRVLRRRRSPAFLSEDEVRRLPQATHNGGARAREDDDRDFYEAHRDELKEDRKLKSLWDRFIFGTPRESEDFLIGIVRCMEVLFNQSSDNAERKLTLRCDHKSKKDFRELNVDAGIYFATRYPAGFKRLLGNQGRFQSRPIIRISGTG